MEVCFHHWKKNPKQIKKKQNKEISQNFKIMTWNLDLGSMKKKKN